MKTIHPRPFLFLLLAALSLLLFARPAAAQQEDAEFRLNVKRNFGLGAGSQIRGTFTNSIIGSDENIQSVTYLIDGNEMATVSQPPFSFQYQTGDYAFGWHDLSARVVTKDGRTVETPVRRFEFVTPEDEMGVVRNYVLPIAASVLGVMVLVYGVQAILLRNKTSSLPLGAPRQYGLFGGTICKRCGRPFPIHMWAVNLFLWKLDRCDFCGKWAAVRRVSPQDLRRAEEAELRSVAAQQPVSAADTAEEARKRLDDTRYIDSDKT